MTQEAALTKDPKQKKIAVLLENSRARMESLLPAHVTADQIITSARLAVYNNPDLRDCKPGTIVQSVMKAAKLGLDPSGTLGSAHLVPFGKRCELIPGYRGLIDLARRSGVVRKLAAHVVYENDEFDYQLGVDETLRHKPTLGEPGEPVAAYAVAYLEDGTHQLEVMTTREINKIRAKSRSKSGPWRSDWSEMARKTVVRRIVKYLPLTPELERLHKAAALDGAAERGEAVDAEAIDAAFDVVPEMETPEPRPTKTERLRDELAQSSSEPEPVEDDGEPSDAYRRIIAALDMAEPEDMQKIKQAILGLEDSGEQATAVRYYSEVREQQKTADSGPTPADTTGSPEPEPEPGARAGARSPEPHTTEAKSASEWKQEAEDLEAELPDEVVAALRKDHDIRTDDALTSTKYHSSTVAPYVEALHSELDKALDSEPEPEADERQVELDEPFGPPITDASEAEDDVLPPPKHTTARQCRYCERPIYTFGSRRFDRDPTGRLTIGMNQGDLAVKLASETTKPQDRLSNHGCTEGARKSRQ